jgi:tetratricopeptide (TPR) repeat protein
MESTDPFTDYFVYNNLGYSLVRLGRFLEAEEGCRQAIEIDPQRPNAFKNLGLALQGQGRHAEAAQCFVKATQVNASDARSLRHLESLLADHAELEFEFSQALAACRAAVKIAAEARTKPAITRSGRRPG